MRQQPWLQLVTSGCCATHLFWRMVVLWYVTPEIAYASTNKYEHRLLFVSPWEFLMVD